MNRRRALTAAAAALAVAALTGCGPWGEWLNARTWAVHFPKDHALSDPSLDTVRAGAISRYTGTWVWGDWYGFTIYSPDEVIRTVDVGPAGSPGGSWEEM